MIAASPLTLASHSGVAPSRLAALAFAPARISSVGQLLVAAVRPPSAAPSRRRPAAR